MGLFGSIFKVVKGVARAGLGVVTHGVSEKVLGALKNLGGAKQVAGTPDLTAQQQALVNKMQGVSPNVKRTEFVLGDIRKRVLQGGGGAADYGTKRMPGRAKRRPAVLKRAVVKMPRAPGTKRAAPKGGLDLKQISVMWASAGKPGKWADFIKANSHIRKA
jgi:hypothetical protein